MLTNRQIIEIIETNEIYQNLLTQLSLQKVVGEYHIDNKMINSAKAQREQLQKQYSQWLDSEVRECVI